ncbi:hypothetical protein BCR34DRAFT_53413 [Clohesyomyces aquaticus]|uniref:Uncharacterized protein n=1 Tax=Clohesyomyces aquaticus TaxID=1231657 RepID=A0A1Y1Z590_9PLEO|nr:hypothetical protein BCR34DRAFT_53413 [Clohesyomyces aquaticus]
MSLPTGRPPYNAEGIKYPSSTTLKSTTHSFSSIFTTLRTAYFFFRSGTPQISRFIPSSHQPARSAMSSIQLLGAALFLFNGANAVPMPQLNPFVNVTNTTSTVFTGPTSIPIPTINATSVAILNGKRYFAAPRSRRQIFVSSIPIVTADPSTMIVAPSSGFPTEPASSIIIIEPTPISSDDTFTTATIFDPVTFTVDPISTFVESSVVASEPTFVS